MPILYLNNNNIGNLTINNTTYYKKYHLNNINNAMINENETNKICIKDNDEIIYEYDMIPIVENFNNLLNNLNEGEYQFNMDMYDDLVPLKYSVIKKK